VINYVVFDAHIAATVHAKGESNPVPVVAQEQDGAVSIIVHAANIKLHSLGLHAAQVSAQPVHLHHESSQKKKSSGMVRTCNEV
jgi:hypothetical protein